ncbi:Sorting nexin-24 [Larimichthys crocea]|uniref:Uncharacterized protein n=1 Tax=Larimichthys crocea TaxID=215358 RepID=A0ACD3QLF7_LARCR|nr:Sorting nexin-24 [Larimichthys crocea]
MHPVRVSIPSFRSENSSMEKGYTVFKIDVLMNGRQHTVEKRYSEFHSLHKMLKKSIKPPEIPSKHVRNWVPKVLEQRRHGLELYLQTIIMENGVLPKIFLDFLNIRHFPSVPKTESCGYIFKRCDRRCDTWSFLPRSSTQKIMSEINKQDQSRRDLKHVLVNKYQNFVNVLCQLWNQRGNADGSWTEG